MVISDFLFLYWVCDTHANMHFSCVWADAYVWYEHMYACINVCMWRTEVGGRKSSISLLYLIH